MGMIRVVLSLLEKNLPVGISDWCLVMHRKIPGKPECRAVYDRQEYPKQLYPHRRLYDVGTPFNELGGPSLR